jgi:hypothetical protein
MAELTAVTFCLFYIAAVSVWAGYWGSYLGGVLGWVDGIARMVVGGGLCC